MGEYPHQNEIVLQIEGNGNSEADAHQVIARRIVPSFNQSRLAFQIGCIELERDGSKSDITLSVETTRVRILKIVVATFALAIQFGGWFGFWVWLCCEAYLSRVAHGTPGDSHPASTQSHPIPQTVQVILNVSGNAIANIGAVGGLTAQEVKASEPIKTKLT